MPEIPTPLVTHFAINQDRLPVCGEQITDDGAFSTTNPGLVTCFQCRNTNTFKYTQQPAKLSTVLKELPIRQQLRRRWTVAVVGGDTDAGFEDWLEAGGVGGSGSRPLHKPPYLNYEGSGVFEFYDVEDAHHSMEVVPQGTGHVEFTLSNVTFLLSHLDRVDLVRALLHDLHYSPEVGGPGDDQD